MTALRRFVERGMHDAESRLARLTTPVAERDDVAVSVVETSGTFGMLARSIDWVERAADGSAIVARGARLYAQWRAAAATDRMRSIGLMLLTGAGVHVLLASTLGATPGWLWLVVPGVTIIIGLLLVAISSRSEQVRTDL